MLLALFAILCTKIHCNFLNSQPCKALITLRPLPRWRPGWGRWAGAAPAQSRISPTWRRCPVAGGDGRGGGAAAAWAGALRSRHQTRSYQSLQSHCTLISFINTAARDSYWSLIEISWSCSQWPPACSLSSRSRGWSRPPPPRRLTGTAGACASKLWTLNTTVVFYK